MRRMPRTAEARDVSGTVGAAKTSRTAVSSRRSSLNQSSSIWWMTMNITSSFDSSASSLAMPFWRDRSDSTSM